MDKPSPERGRSMEKQAEPGENRGEATRSGETQRETAGRREKQGGSREHEEAVRSREKQGAFRSPAGQVQSQIGSLVGP